ncbi:thiamine phosphate synthase [Virgibacillus phasianinus]|uniref:Thiamine phosphate synthase n=1 Tax=Virgibacillus phasianinus TaxID=2017483 RepID=A0A220U720_9BACI|nr:thiamine phosphate synthase [Virgibacillus phasianinus]ASK63917.1 thiamine phosphate synthase [Virgibacillus phasianinus]
MSGELHVISTGKQSLKTVTSIMRQIHPFIDYFHLREKSWSAHELIQGVKSLSVAGVPTEKIMINDRVDVAHAMNTRGVQLSDQSMGVELVNRYYNHLRIGCSVHHTAKGVAAAKHGADYLLFGHIFETQSKPGMKPKGLASLREMVERVPIPVIAIGGITPANTSDVIQNGASGIAVLSGVLLADDPLKAALAYQKALKNSTYAEGRCKDEPKL